MNAVSSRYDAVAMSLHWLIAGLILWDFALAISFSHFDPGDRLYFSFAYDQHMSVGMWVLALSLLRLMWRLTHRFPALPPEMSAGMRMLARSSHALLYVFMLVVPLTGWMVLSARKKPPALAGDLHWPALGIADLPHAQRSAIHDVALPGHIWLAYIGMALLAAHILAAFYHHGFKRDDVLRRILPGTRLRQAGDHR